MKTTGLQSLFHKVTSLRLQLAKTENVSTLDLWQSPTYTYEKLFFKKKSELFERQSHKMVKHTQTN